VVVLGHPGYYPRFGFRPSRFGLCWAQEAPDEASQALEQESGAVVGVKGVRCGPEFEGLCGGENGCESLREGRGSALAGGWGIQSGVAGTTEGTPMDDVTSRFFDAVAKHCRLITTPVGVKLVKEGEAAPRKMKYPMADLGNRLAVCQGMSLARTFGWTVGFRAEDHACPLPRVFLGHIAPDKLLEGTIAGPYQDDPACRQEMEASYPRWPLGSFHEVWLAPLDRCAFVPDLAVAYGNPAQILTLIQAANFRHGPGIRSVSSGRYGCSSWLAGVAQAEECTYLVPGPGERVFAGTQDHEMSFAAPYSQFDRVTEGLAYVRSHGAFRFPVPQMALLAEPNIPAKYHEIEP